jgi:AcrR family transcriptional regulator
VTFDVWLRPQRRSRGEPALSREQIVAAALSLLDSEGVEALSMRRLGAKLNAGATSLYWHVANKEQLLALVVDEVFGEIESPDPDDPVGWRTAAMLCGHSIRAVMLRHSWLGPLMSESGYAYGGPAMMRLSEALLATFEKGGATPEAAEGATQTLCGYVMGVATAESARLRMLTRAGEDEGEWMARAYVDVEEIAEPYPRIADLYARHRGEDPRMTRDRSFQYGLEMVLDGVATRLPTPAP